jgi:hypothetical protein
MGRATPLGRLVAGLLSRKPWANPGPVQANVVVNQVTLWQVSLRVLRFPPSVLFHRCAILMQLLRNGQTGTVGTFKQIWSCGSPGALGRKVFSPYNSLQIMLSNTRNLQVCQHSLVFLHSTVHITVISSTQVQVIATDSVSPNRWTFIRNRFAYPVTRLPVHCPFPKARFASGRFCGDYDFF